MRVIVDAEQTWLQPAIDALALATARRYNTHASSSPLILNTYQCYLMGAKPVRGAFLLAERARAAAAGEPSPCHPTIDATHAAADGAAARGLDRGSAGREELMAASHNVASIGAAADGAAARGLDRGSAPLYLPLPPPRPASLSSPPLPLPLPPADDCEHIDQVWDPTHPTVGPAGLRHYLHDVRSAFPDFCVEITEIATCDTNTLWVMFEGNATGLGEWHGHRPSHHTSSFTGVNIVKFNEDRSKITQLSGTFLCASLFVIATPSMGLISLSFVLSSVQCTARRLRRTGRSCGRRCRREGSGSCG